MHSVCGFAKRINGVFSVRFIKLISTYFSSFLCTDSLSSNCSSFETNFWQALVILGAMSSDLREIFLRLIVEILRKATKALSIL
jgi:hypothetical protein